MHVMTKKYLKLYILAGLSLLSLVGCQKDGQGVTLKAKISPVANGADKLYIQDLSTYWTSGDKVFVNGQSGLAVTVGDNGSATINGVTSSAPYTAVYPSSIVTDASVASSTVNVTLPATQEYREDNGKQIVAVPMAAYTTGTTLEFKNLCSVVNVDVTNSTGAAFSLNSISITASGARLSGAGVLTVNGSTSSLAMSGDANSSVSLSFGTSPYELSANASKSFYLVLPAFDQTGIDIVLSTTSGEYSYQKTKSLPTNRIAQLNLTVEAAQEPPMSGEFKVDAYGKKVKFALGNLQYSTSGTHATADGNYTTGTWRFAEHQYDASASGWTCSFQWGTSGYEGSYPGASVLPGTDANYDWGVYNAISNGGNTVGYWRTLTKDEWNYLLHTRNTTNSSRRFVRAKVNGIEGLLLFPDGYTWPTTSIAEPTIGLYGNCNKASISISSIDLSGYFDDFQQAGFVFLPGSLNSSSANYYWTSDKYSVVFWTSQGNDCRFWSSSNTSDSRYVRLVHPIN